MVDSGKRHKAMSEAEALKFSRLGYRGDISKLDAEGRSLLWRAGDLRARLMLNDLYTAEYAANNFEGTCTLIHAERYLADRLAYELQPWPKGKVKNESIDPLPPTCPECRHLIIQADRCYECKTDFCSMECTLNHKHVEAVGDGR